MISYLHLANIHLSIRLVVTEELFPLMRFGPLCGDEIKSWSFIFESMRKAKFERLITDSAAWINLKISIVGFWIFEPLVSLPAVRHASRMLLIAEVIMIDSVSASCSKWTWIIIPPTPLLLTVEVFLQVFWGLVNVHWIINISTLVVPDVLKVVQMRLYKPFREVNKLNLSHLFLILLSWIWPFSILTEACSASNLPLGFYLNENAPRCTTLQPNTYMTPEVIYAIDAPKRALHMLGKCKKEMAWGGGL